MSADADVEVLRSVMRAIREGVLVWSVPTGVLLTCNEAASRILGVPSSELEGRSLDYPWQLAREDGSPRDPSERGAFLAVRTGQSQPSAVVRVGRPDGTYAWVRSSSIVLRDAAESPYAVVTTFVDVTELRQATEQVKVIANRLAEAMAGANMGTWDLDLESGQVERNPRWSDILGEVPSAIEPTLAGFTDRIHPDDRATCVAIMEAGFRTGVPFILECRARHKDGHFHWVQARGKAVEQAADGRWLRVAGVLVDIDARKRTEETLRTTLAENERLIRELQSALENVRTLEGLLPICMYCKSIRDEAGTWSKLETYVSQRAKVSFSHGICPSCYTNHSDEA